MSKAKFDEYGHIRVGGKVASTCLGPNEVEKLDFGPIFNILDRFGVRENQAPHPLVFVVTR